MEYGGLINVQIITEVAWWGSEVLSCHILSPHLGFQPPMSDPCLVLTTLLPQGFLLSQEDVLSL